MLGDTFGMQLNTKKEEEIISIHIHDYKTEGR